MVMSYFGRLVADIEMKWHIPLIQGKNVGCKRDQVYFMFSCNTVGSGKDTYEITRKHTFRSLNSAAS